MLDIFLEFATNEDAENNGVWRSIGKGAELLIARAGNDAYSRAVSTLVDEHREVLDMKNDAATAKSTEIMIQVLAETILLGWKGIVFKGQPMEYSVENAKKLLAVRDFRLMVQRLSDESAAYRAKLEEEQGKA